MSQTIVLALSPPDPAASFPAELPDNPGETPGGEGVLVIAPGSPATWPVQTTEHLGLWQSSPGGWHRKRLRPGQDFICMERLV